MFYKKRILIVSVLMAALLAQFWLGSRYPSIDEKAAMAGEVVMEDVLSFEAAFPIDPTDPLWKRIGYSTLNWISTNRQGMQFGILFATLVLTIIQLWPRKLRPKRTMRDILRGVLVGAPMGVCVNCAAPIAYGMHKQGGNNETSLAMMFASPTLNILVLAMMFSILPMHLAVAKLAVTFLFLFMVLPLLIRFWAPTPEQAENTVTSGGPGAPALAEPEPWWSAITGVAKDLIGNFLFIVIRTVPLMLLAGLLGSALATALPMETFSSWNISLLAMGGVALLGTFAPTPIAFDVVVVQALLAAGLPEQFATVLLVTLGMFSIYPFLLVTRMISLRFSAVLFTAVAALGLAAGYGVGFYADFREARNAAVFEAHFSGRFPEDMQSAHAVADITVSRDENARIEDASRGHLRFENSEIRVESTAFTPSSPAGERHFSHYPGTSLGLVPPAHQVLDFMLPFSQGRGIASGDFDGDGWPDIAAANNNGISLFRNIEGARFERWPLDIPGLEGLSALLVSFVDLDNDGCLDLFVGAFGDADYAVVNDCAGFKKPGLVGIPHEGPLMTQAAAFADPDTDGDLDILKGNWFFLIPRTAPSERAANFIAENLGGLNFSQRPLDELTGYTLAVLWSDYDLDSRLDMVIGNDYMEPDIYYRGTADRGFEQVQAGGIIPHSTLATMSIDSADIDNDLDFDLFLTGKVNDFGTRRESERTQRKEGENTRQFVIRRMRHFQQRYCAEFTNDEDARRCQTGFAHSDLIRSNFMSDCHSLETLEAQDECMLAVGIRDSLIKREWSFCAQIPALAFPVHRQMCEAYAEYDASSEPKEMGYKYLDQGEIDQKMQGNVLLVQQEDGSFADLAEDFGVYDSYWAWSGRFADLDQDGWQDLFVTNGWWLETSMYTNDFFRNNEGRGFERRAVEFGLENRLKQCCYTYIDMDRDGDLDIVSRSADGGFDVYFNGSQDNNAVMFELRDALGNRFGIGAKIIVHYGENGEHRQIREIKSGGGFASYDAPFAHFGLGASDRVEGVTVIWPDGQRSEIDRPLEAGHRYFISRRAPAIAGG